MNERIEESTSRLFTQSAELLAELDGIDALVAATAGHAAQSREIEHIEALRLMHESMNQPVEGSVDLNFSDDEITATMDFSPSSGDAPPVGMDVVRSVISANAISVTIAWPAIEKALNSCNTDQQPIAGVVVASGYPPVDAEPEHWVVEEEILTPPTPLAVNEQEQVDYRAVTPFRLVKRGQVLARRSPPVPGKFGCTVRGKALPFRTLKVDRLTLGHDVIQAGDTVQAACDGRLFVGNHEISVSPVLQVSHDVDYSTGHIDFPGDVIVHGDIKTGFKVQSGGSLICHQTIEAAVVTCETDLIVKRGIVGNQSGSVNAKGSVKAKFVENAFLESGGPVHVQVGILNSIVQTLDRVDTGSRGIIVGGKITAGRGISAAQVGSAMGPRTELYCGIDYTVEQQMTWLRDKGMALAAKLSQVRRHIATVGNTNENLEQLQVKLKQAVHQVNEAAEKLIFQLDRDEAADVRVSGTVFAGTYVEICHMPYVVTQPLKRQRFRLDKFKGKVVAEPW